MARNVELQRRMQEVQVTQSELARLVNIEIEKLTGKLGTVSERTIQNWLSGQSKWPPAKMRKALEGVFGCTGPDLGFIPPRSHGAAAPEDPVNRRSFVTAIGGATLSATVPTAVAPHRIGMSDVQQLQTRFADLIASDHQLGGQKAIESHAVALAREALELQQRGSASQRVRDSLYACAAGFMSSAMWAAIDGRRFEAAEGHHERAAKLALMSGDQTIQFRIWSHAGSLYRHMRRPADALATNDVARNLGIARRDPLFASLGHARQAAIHGLTGDANAVHRSIGHAQETLDKAQPDRPRPVWLAAHYDQAELDSLALAAHLALGRYEDAESHAHRSLALLRPHMRRSRAITSARLARAQLGQGDVEPAISTAMSIPTPLAAHPRVAGMLRSFGDTLDTVAGDSEHTRTWHQFAHDTRRLSA